MGDIVAETKIKTNCSYCGDKKFYIYHRGKDGRPDWAICLKCLKKAIDAGLGKVGKNGGRVK